MSTVIIVKCDGCGARLSGSPSGRLTRWDLEEEFDLCGGCFDDIKLAMRKRQREHGKTLPDDPAVPA